MSLIITVGFLAFSTLSLAQSNDPTVPAETTPAENVLPAKTVKTPRQFNGLLFAGKVLIGTVSQNADKIITVTQKNGTDADIITTEVTKFIKGGRKVGLSGIVVGDSLVAVGASSVDGTFLAKTIVAKSKVLKELKKVPFYGLVNEVGSKSFTLKNKNDGAVTEILVNNQTVIKRLGKKVLLNTMASGQTAVAITIMENNGTYTGKMVQLLDEAPASSDSEIQQSTPSPEVQP